MNSCFSSLRHIYSVVITHESITMSAMKTMRLGADGFRGTEAPLITVKTGVFS